MFRLCLYNKEEIFHILFNCLCDPETSTKNGLFRPDCIGPLRERFFPGFSIPAYQLNIRKGSDISWRKEATKKIILLNRKIESELDDHR